MAIHKTGLR